MTTARAGLVTKALDLMLSAGTPQPKRKKVARCEPAGVALHVFNSGFRDLSEVKSPADFIQSRMHQIVEVPILRLVHEPVKAPKQGKREARRRKRQMAKIARRKAVDTIITQLAA